ncbi:MAG: DUF1638 domain-containing protein [Phycisphaerae bacterium]|nr:DUF1638 domain-containing protein [Phycisphaerae bacterium]
MNSNYESPQIENTKRLRLITCEIFTRELALLTATSENIVSTSYLRKGLHDTATEKMQQTIQAEIDGVTGDFEAILLGYGRCNNGLAGIKANAIPLIIPKIHDCIGAFMGGNGQYMDTFAQNARTFYRSSGWMERDKYDDDSVMHQLGLDNTYDEYVKKYGEDNARYIMETMGNWTSQYKELAYIKLGLAIDQKYEQLARQEARQRKLEFRSIEGTMSLLRDFIDGNWDDKRFLTVPPGCLIIADDDEVLKVQEPA